MPAAAVTLAGHGRLDGAAGIGRAVEVKRVARGERWDEERKPLDVIPVDVAEEDVERERRLLRERGAELSDAGPRVEDDPSAAAVHLDAARISSEMIRLGTRGGDAPPDSPKGGADHLHSRTGQAGQPQH